MKYTDQYHFTGELPVYMDIRFIFIIYEKRQFAKKFTPAICMIWDKYHPPTLSFPIDPTLVGVRCNY